MNKQWIIISNRRFKEKSSETYIPQRLQKSYQTGYGKLPVQPHTGFAYFGTGRPHPSPIIQEDIIDRIIRTFGTFGRGLHQGQVV
jgi:hypothetical protein